MTRGMNFDEIFRTLGCFGPWQLLHATGAIVSWMHAAMSILIFITAGHMPDHVCTIPGKIIYSNLTREGQCELLNVTSNETTTCSYGYEFNASNPASSLVTEWNLVCGRDYLPHISQTAFMGGQALGSHIFSSIADKYGRKRTYLVLHSFLIFIEISGSFVPDIYWFIAFRFFTGVAQMGICTISYVIVVEMYPISHNHLVGMWFGVMDSVGVCLSAFLSYMMQNVSWRYLHLSVGCLFIPILIYQFLVFDESVRWLFANNRRNEAVKILHKACRINRVAINKLDKLLSTDESRLMPSYEQNELKALPKNSNDTELDVVYETEKETEKLNFVSILRHKKLLKHLLLSWIIWPTQSLTFYGLTLMANVLAGNRHLNLFFYGLVDLPSKLFLGFLSNRMGRKPMYAVLMVPCSVALLIASLMATPNIGYPMLTTVFSITAKFFIGAAFIVVWIHTPELYPTNLRSTGLGSANGSARFAGMIAPFAGYLAKYVPWGPGAIFSVMGIVSCVLLLFLPETKNKPLIQSIHDVNSLYYTTSKISKNKH